ncbi:MAG: isoprenylcysteine carboxylmethyltransferase family protein [Halomonadaceae bacterium]|nr:MAG: isoprenylcysteine carboxylmethyltransferase family protein [Halomonadaceae bacterium]
MDIELFVRYFLGIYFLLIGLNYTSASIALRQRTGLRQIHYGPAGSRTWWYRQAFNGFRGTILGVCLVRMVWPLDPWLGIITPLYQPALLLTGVFLMLAAFTLIAYVHSYMHNDWRSGIDPDLVKPLITDGPFSRSRNPLFMAIMTGQLGFFLALPSLFSLICLLTGATVLALQTRAEEAHLQALHPDDYRAYQQQVRRWL